MLEKVVHLTEQPALDRSEIASLVRGFSIEVTPRTAAKIVDLRGSLPNRTRVYIAHTDGTSTMDMTLTARRITDNGFVAMPHIPARSILGRYELEELLLQYRNDAGVEEALLLAGGLSQPRGPFTSSVELIETGLFDKMRFRRLHVAGHPEGNRDIDPDKSSRNADAALLWKSGHSQRTDAEMAITTQFAFDAKPVIAWAERIAAAGITLPIHLGIAGPTKLQTLIKFAIACGVGPSLAVLQKRALDLSKLLVPYKPTEMLTDIAAYKAAHPETLIEQVHVFPLGGIRSSAEWMNEQLIGEHNIAT